MALKRRYDDMTIIKSKLDTFILKYCFRYNKTPYLLPFWGNRRQLIDFNKTIVFSNLNAL